MLQQKNPALSLLGRGVIFSVLRKASRHGKLLSLGCDITPQITTVYSPMLSRSKCYQAKLSRVSLGAPGRPVINALNLWNS